MTDTDRYSLRRSILHGLRALMALLLFLFPAIAQGQDEGGYNEVPVAVNVQGIGIAELPAVIRQQDLYLSVTDLFEYLKIRTVASAHLDSVTGFFATPEAVYLIDKSHHRIVYQDKTWELKEDDLLRTETGLYLKSSYLGTVFGLLTTFNFRGLSASISTQVELPWIREMRQEQIRRNLSSLKNEPPPDTTIGREALPFHFGTADWNIVAGQKNGGQTDVRMNLGLGLVIAGGETNIGLSYSSTERPMARNQFYMWRYVNNDRKALRQVRIGKISSNNSISSIFAPVVGMQVTNTPTTFRKSFGTYTLSNVTKPGWVVELYVNNVLLEYKKAGPSGFYSFEVPLLYGTSVVKLRFYGPWGEEYTREEVINIPFSFVPEKTFEYTASTGMVEDGKRSMYTAVNMNYGVSRRLSIGGGVEYLSSVSSGPVIPYVGASARLASSLMLSAEYAHGVRSKATLNYRLPSNLMVELNYMNYKDGQTAISNSYLEERKAVISMPLRLKRLSLFSQLKVHDILLQDSRVTTGEWMLTANAFGTTTNFSTYVTRFNEADPSLFSNLSMAFRLPGRITLTPGVQYDYSRMEIMMAKCMLEKNIRGKGFLNLTYEHQFSTGLKNLMVSLRYDLSYSQVGFSAAVNEKETILTETVRGSLMFDARSRYVDVNNRISVGRGGLVVTSFLDVNNNGVRDAGEPKVPGLKFRISAGRVEDRPADTSARVFDLEPYASYFLELDEGSFDNIAWQIRKRHLSIAITPNTVTALNVPVSVVAEVSGKVLLEGADKSGKGQGRIMVNIYRSDSTLATRVMTESNGSFYYIGLAPGTYFARIDGHQLTRLRAVAVPSSLPVTIRASRDGDVVEGLQFLLQPAPGSAGTGPEGEDPFGARQDAPERK